MSMAKVKEMTINMDRLLGAYSVYKNAHQRYTHALEMRYQQAAINYERQLFEEAHRNLLEAGLANLDSDGCVRIQLPAQGRLGDSQIYDLPVFRSVVDKDVRVWNPKNGKIDILRGVIGWFKFERMQDGHEILSQIDPHTVPMYDHEVCLNDDGEGYCLLFEDHVLKF